MSAHTLGPWYVGRTLSDNTLCVIGDGDSVICTFSSFGANDARLIAAAPELLSSLRDLLVCMGLAGWEGDPLAEKARAAIAKATGEQA